MTQFVSGTILRSDKESESMLSSKSGSILISISGSILISKSKSILESKITNLGFFSGYEAWKPIFRISNSRTDFGFRPSILRSRLIFEVMRNWAGIGDFFSKTPKMGSFSGYGAWKPDFWKSCQMTLISQVIHFGSTWADISPQPD